MASVVLTGCGDMIHVQTNQSEEEKEKLANAPSYVEAQQWPAPIISEFNRDRIIVDSIGTKVALDLARKEVEAHNGYEARFLLRQIGGYKDVQRGIFVNGFFEEDLKNVMDGKPLQRWNSGKQKGSLEEEAIGFLDFMSGVYETWFRSDPVKNESQTAFNNLIRAMSARDAYRSCIGTTNSIPETIRRKYLGSGPDLENFLAGKFKAEEGAREEYTPVALSLPPFKLINGANVAVASSTKSPEVAPSVKMRDYMSEQSKSWNRQYLAREAIRAVEESSQRIEHASLLSADPVSGKIFENPQNYTVNSRENILKVAGRY